MEEREIERFFKMEESNTMFSALSKSEFFNVM